MPPTVGVNSDGRPLVVSGPTQPKSDDEWIDILMADFAFSEDTTQLKIDAEWIDIETLKHWLRYCDEHHGEKCKAPQSKTPKLLEAKTRSRTQQFRQKIRHALSSSKSATIATKELHSDVAQPQGRPQWLIDVQRSCVVPAGEHDEYAALSYVWGQVPMLKTMKTNLSQLQTEGSLRTIENQIPKTIRHAIALTHLLDIRLLWVDCLCIVQDDDENLYAQLQDMASIFAGAYVTIVAANGWDADHGLRGIKGVSDPRQLSAEFDLYESLQPHSSIWYSRGWTFQEMVFSRRTIMLQYQLAIWGCRTASWHEGTRDLDFGAYSTDELHISKWGGRKFETHPSPLAYIKLVREYNNRSLTYDTDAYPAITGLLSMWSQSFYGGFISGLPQMFFESALLWQPSEPLQRRVSSNRGTQQYHTPSWSWLGWRGEIDTEDWSTRWDLIEPLPRPRVTSIHKWYHGDRLNNMELVDIASSRSTNYGDASVDTLPRGWERVHIGTSNARFTHERYPGVFFPYPLPLPDEGSRIPLKPPVKFLSCRTDRAFLEGQRQTGLHGSEVCTFFALYEEARRPTALCIGYVRSHDSSRPQSSRIFELVALSDSVVPIDDPGVLLIKKSRFAKHNDIFRTGFDGLEYVTFRNVMWIERKQGVAYRKGLGQVVRQDWEGLALEHIDLVLG